MKMLFLFSFLLSSLGFSASVNFIYDFAADQVTIKGSGHYQACVYRVKVGDVWEKNMKNFPVGSNGTINHKLAVGAVPSPNTAIEVRTYQGCDGSYKLDSFERNEFNRSTINYNKVKPEVSVYYNNRDLLTVKGENLGSEAAYLKFRIVEQGWLFDDYGWYVSRAGNDTWEIKNGKFTFTLNQEVSERAQYPGYTIEARIYNSWGMLVQTYRVAGRSFSPGLVLILDLY